MFVTINGDRKKFDRAMPIDVLLEDLGIEKRQIAVEKNAEIVPKSKFAETLIADGDQIEIIQFVGGG
ncbi:MAG: sulfur carrier protein ThiS [Pseudomonadota bacterium]